MSALSQLLALGYWERDPDKAITIAPSRKVLVKTNEHGQNAAWFIVPAEQIEHARNIIKHLK